MKQQTIKMLLTKASGACGLQEHLRIQQDLVAALLLNVGDNQTGRALKSFLQELFSETARHRPDLLLDLLPVFTILCGDREKGEYYGIIDWDQID